MPVPTTSLETNIVISAELLQLFKWILENEQEMLHLLMQRALQGTTKPSYSPAAPPPSAQEIKEQLIQFFNMLEGMAQDSIQDAAHSQQVRSILFPEVDHIDSSQCELEALSCSIEKATTATELVRSDTKSSKEVFCKELLKHWRPLVKSHTIH